jgi:hypothetical protein
LPCRTPTIRSPQAQDLFKRTVHAISNVC